MLKEFVAWSIYAGAYVLWGIAAIMAYIGFFWEVRHYRYSSPYLRRTAAILTLYGALLWVIGVVLTSYY